uniref:Uncharacterized protein n=1 Tax=Anopheles dirus TaxID=7168 RepID=A0A182NW82_9DIPT
MVEAYFPGSRLLCQRAILTAAERIHVAY